MKKVMHFVHVYYTCNSISHTHKLNILAPVNAKFRRCFIKQNHLRHVNELHESIVWDRKKSIPVSVLRVFFLPHTGGAVNFRYTKVKKKKIKHQINGKHLTFFHKREGVLSSSCAFIKELVFDLVNMCLTQLLILNSTIGTMLVHCR